MFARTRLLAALLLVAPACSGKGSDIPDQGGPSTPPACQPGGTAKQGVVNRFVMPTVAQPCSVDVDGDGRKDNALLVVAAGLRAASFDLQASADAVVQSGQLLQLLALDAGSATDPACAGVTVERGLTPATPPRLDGSDRFMVDPSVAPVTLIGAIQQGQFSTLLPTQQTPGDVAQAALSLPAGFGINIPLPVWGAHMSAVTGPQGVVQGELHGVVRLADVQGRMIPAIAQVMTAVVHKEPNSPDAQSIIATFETAAKCQAMPDLCCKKDPMTCQITADEVRKNPKTQLILKPDVQMFKGSQWSPNPQPDQPDSLSIGLCFTAQPATF